MFAMGPAFFKQTTASYATLALTGAFAAATVGAVYSSSLAITGGLAPYSLTGGTGVASGTLPAGLSLSISGSNLVLSGTPTTAATSAFTVSVGSTDVQTATSAQSVAVSAATANYFDPAKKGADIVLSNSNKTSSKSSVNTWQSVFGLDSQSSGKRYLEFAYITTNGFFTFFGLGNTSSPVGSYLGSDNNGWGIGANNTRYHGGVDLGTWGPGVNSGDVVGLAIDFTTGNVYLSINGAWAGGGTPGSGATALFTGVSGTLYPIASLYTTSMSATLRLLNSEFSNAPPSGYTAWA